MTRPGRLLDPKRRTLDRHEVKWIDFNKANLVTSSEVSWDASSVNRDASSEVDWKNASSKVRDYSSKVSRDYSREVNQESGTTSTEEWCGGRSHLDVLAWTSLTVVLC